METFFKSLIVAIPKLRSKIQLLGLIVAIVAYIATKIVMPDQVMSQIAAGSIGLLILIFASITAILPQIQEGHRTFLFLFLFTLTILLIGILLWFTIINVTEFNQHVEKRLKFKADSTEHALYLIHQQDERERKDFEKNEKNSILVNWARQIMPPLNSLDDSSAISQINMRKDLFLAEAIEKNDYEITVILLKNGSNPNSMKTDSQTPLVLACQLHHLGIVQLLIENGAEVNKPTSGGFYPIHWSNYYSNNLSTNYLDKNLVSLLIKNGANINQKNQQGKTLLHSVVHFSCEKLSQPGVWYEVDFLLKNGAKSSIKDEDGETALDYAKKCKNQKLIKRLM